MPGGRPPRFATVEEMQEAFADWKKELAFGGSLYGEIPDVEGFCDFIGCWRDLLFEYEKKPEFTDAIKEIKNWIYARKKQLAMQGKMPPAVFIFDAKNNAGYTDKQETDITTNGKDMPGTVLVRFVGEHDEREDDRTTG